MTSTDDRIDLYQRAFDRYSEVSEVRGIVLSRLTKSSLRAVVDLVLAERPEPTDWETLANAAEILQSGRGFRGAGVVRAIIAYADRLEAEHAATQAEAAADAAREALIEKANVIFREAWHAEDARSGGGSRVTAGMKAVAAAGLLVDPEAEATA